MIDERKMRFGRLFMVWSKKSKFENFLFFLILVGSLTNIIISIFKRFFFLIKY